MTLRETYTYSCKNCQSITSWDGIGNETLRCLGGLDGTHHPRIPNDSTKDSYVYQDLYMCRDVYIYRKTSRSIYRPWDLRGYVCRERSRKRKFEKPIVYQTGLICVVESFTDLSSLLLLKRQFRFKKESYFRIISKKESTKGP